MRAPRSSLDVPVRRLLERVPPPPKQSEMRGMETNDAARFLHTAKVAREGKTSKNRKAEDQLDFQFRSYQLPPFGRQFKLLKTVQKPRKDGRNIPGMWRFDFCFPGQQVIVEVDGGIFMPKGGAHSHPVDIKRNLMKRNDAALAGFLVLGFMPEQIRSDEAIAFVQHVLYAKGWRR